MKRLFTTQQRYALAAAVFLSLFVCIVLLKKPIQVSNPHSHFPTKRSDVVAKDSREQSKMIARPQNIRTTTQPQSSARIVRQTRPNTKAASHNRFQNPNSAKSQSGCDCYSQYAAIHHGSAPLTHSASVWRSIRPCYFVRSSPSWGNEKC